MNGYLKSDNLTAIGRVQRTHGIKGELNIELYDPDKAVPSDFSCLIFDLDGTFVPFGTPSSPSTSRARSTSSTPLCPS